MKRHIRPADPSENKISDDPLWSALELPPTSPVPQNYAVRVVEHCRNRGAVEEPLGSMARAAALAALVLGAALGFWAGDGPMGASNSELLLSSPRPAPSAPPHWAHAPSLSELFWTTDLLDANQIDSDLPSLEERP